jgi:hypothetical protein
MWKPIKAATLGLLLALAVGCAGNPGNHSFIVIGLERDPGCKTVAELKVTGASKGEIKEKLKEEAANHQANFVHLKDLTQNRDTRQYTAYATACTCR